MSAAAARTSIGWRSTFRVNAIGYSDDVIGSTAATTPTSAVKSDHASLCRRAIQCTATTPNIAQKPTSA
jgi:hypothetical protein